MNTEEVAHVTSCSRNKTRSFVRIAAVSGLAVAALTGCVGIDENEATEIIAELEARGFHNPELAANNNNGNYPKFHVGLGDCNDVGEARVTIEVDMSNNNIEYNQANRGVFIDDAVPAKFREHASTLGLQSCFPEQ